MTSERNLYFMYGNCLCAIYLSIIITNNKKVVVVDDAVVDDVIII